VIVLSCLLSGGMFLLYLDARDFPPGGLRILFFALILLLPAVWGGRSLTKPFRYRLDRETLDIQRVLGTSEILDLWRVESDLGHVVDIARNRRFWVGLAKFPGADRFHRALRVRRARVAGSRTP